MYEDLPVARRIVITIIIVVAIILVLAAIGYFSGRWSDASAATGVPSKQIALCSDEPDINTLINELAFRALDDALRKQVENLFTTWMKDEAGQPERAATGVKRAALAYVHARQAILDWNIPRCTAPN